MQIERRVQQLEQMRQARDNAEPLLDFRWDGPDPRNRVTFKIDGYGIVDQQPDETDDDYRARAFELCKEVYRHRPEMPTIKIFLPG